MINGELGYRDVNERGREREGERIRVDFFFYYNFLIDSVVN